MKKLLFVMLSFMLAKDHKFEDMRLEHSFAIKQKDSIDNLYFNSLHVTQEGKFIFTNPNEVHNPKVVLHIRDNAVIEGQLIANDVQLEIIAQKSLLIENATISSFNLNIRAKENLTINNSSLCFQDALTKEPITDRSTTLILSGNHIDAGNSKIMFNNICIDANCNKTILDLVTFELQSDAMIPFLYPIALEDVASPCGEFLLRSSISINKCEISADIINLDANSILIENASKLDVAILQMGEQGYLFDVTVVDSIIPDEKFREHFTGTYHTDKSHLPDGKIPSEYYYIPTEVSDSYPDTFSSAAAVAGAAAPGAAADDYEPGASVWTKPVPQADSQLIELSEKVNTYIIMLKHDATFKLILPNLMQNPELSCIGIIKDLMDKDEAYKATGYPVDLQMLANLETIASYISA